LGSDTFLHINADELGNLTARVDGEFDVTNGDTVFLTADPEKLHRFDVKGITMS